MRATPWPVYLECAKDNILYRGFDMTAKCPECGTTMRKGFDFVDHESARLVIDVTGRSEADDEELGLFSGD